MTHLDTSAETFKPTAEIDDLDALASRIREAHRAAHSAGAALLHHAMEAGDALIAAQAKVSGNWKAWLRNNCFLSVRTALVYQRLAKHRDQIEAELGRAGDLSLRAALRLIAEPKPKASEKGRRAEKADTSPDDRLTKALRQALSHLKLAETSATTDITQINAALTALRAILRLHPDINGLTVGVVAEQGRRKRAA